VLVPPQASDPELIGWTTSACSPFFQSLLLVLRTYGPGIPAEAGWISEGPGGVAFSSRPHGDQTASRDGEQGEIEPQYDHVPNDQPSQAERSQVATQQERRGGDDGYASGELYPRGLPWRLRREMPRVRSVAAMHAAWTAGAIEMNGRLASVNGNQSQTAQNASPENPWKPMNQRA